MGKQLLDLARAVRSEKLIVEPLCMRCVERIKLALDFQAKGPAFCFRAIAEEWTLDRIVREVRT